MQHLYMSAFNCQTHLSSSKILWPIVLNNHKFVEHEQSSVLALEDSALDVDQVDNLIKFCPTKDEIELIKV